MMQLHVDLDDQKYIMKFLPGNQVKITQTENKNKFIIIQYFADTKVTDFMQYIKSLDFSKLKDNELYTLKLCCW